MKPLLFGITIVFFVANIIQAEKLYSRKEAYRVSTNQIVLHYGEGMMGVNELAIGLRREGYPAIAAPVGPKEQVELFLDRKMPGKYNQHDLDSGRLGGDVILFFDKYVKNNSAENSN